MESQSKKQQQLLVPMTADEETAEEESSQNNSLRAQRRRRNMASLRQPRQKYCASWEEEFSWLKSDKLDESLGICTVCDKQLVCKKSHLERHQRSFKHQRNMGFDESNFEAESETKTQPTAMVFLECGKHEITEQYDYDHSIEMEVDGSGSTESDQVNLQSSSSRLKRENANGKTATAFKSSKAKVTNERPGRANKIDRMKLLKRIDRDRNELNEIYYSRRQQQNHAAPATQTSQQRDSFDMFFESISASVKSLPPKLAAEAKGRVSQLIAEYEVRAICEREALADARGEVAGTLGMQMQADSATLVASTTPEITVESLGGANAVPHIVYAFQPKLRE